MTAAGPTSALLLAAQQLVDDARRARTAGRRTTADPRTTLPARPLPRPKEQS